MMKKMAVAIFLGIVLAAALFFADAGVTQTPGITIGFAIGTALDLQDLRSTAAVAFGTTFIIQAFLFSCGSQRVNKLQMAQASANATGMKPASSTCL